MSNRMQNMQNNIQNNLNMSICQYVYMSICQYVNMQNMHVPILYAKYAILYAKYATLYVKQCAKRVNLYLNASSFCTCKIETRAHFAYLNDILQIKMVTLQCPSRESDRAAFWYSAAWSSRMRQEP